MRMSSDCEHANKKLALHSGSLDQRLDDAPRLLVLACCGDHRGIFSRLQTRAHGGKGIGVSGQRARERGETERETEEDNSKQAM